MTIAIYPGSFDPITKGHLGILRNGAEIFDKVIIAIANNAEKKNFLSLQTRLELIRECVKDIKNVEVDYFDGLTVDYAKKRNASVLIRGLRTFFDFEYETQMLQVNSTLDNNIKTVFLVAKPEYSFISSSAVREILSNNGDIKEFVPSQVYNYFINKPII